MTKTEVINMFMKAVGQYTTAIDKTAETNIQYKKSVYALEDVAKREAEYQLEVARANESRIKAEVDQIKYIIRALEVKEEA